MRPLALMLILSSAARADEPQAGPPRMPVDESPTPFACTLDNLVEDSPRRCTLDWDAPQGAADAARAKANVAKAGELAAKACGTASKNPESRKAVPGVAADCLKDFREAAADSCGLEGKGALADDKGRLSVHAQDCWNALREVLSKTRSAAGLPKLDQDAPAPRVPVKKARPTTAEGAARPKDI